MCVSTIQEESGSDVWAWIKYASPQVTGLRDVGQNSQTMFFYIFFLNPRISSTSQGRNGCISRFQLSTTEAAGAPLLPNSWTSSPSSHLKAALSYSAFLKPMRLDKLGINQHDLNSWFPGISPVLTPTTLSPCQSWGPGWIPVAATSSVEREKQFINPSYYPY